MSVVRATVVALVVGSAGMIGASVTVAPPAGAADPPVGTVTGFASPSPTPGAIAAGPDGALWVTAPELQASSKIRRVSTAGVATSYTDPDLRYAAAITPGPDGALWITDTSTQSIWRITTAGQLSLVASPGVILSRGFTAGPDGAVWFSGVRDSHTVIGRVTPAGAVTTFDVATSVYPQAMVAGPDGALWWVGNGLVGRTTVAGATTLSPDPAAPFAGSIAAGPDGALWYTDSVAGSVTRLTVGGTRTVVRKGDIGAPEHIVSGPDQALWFTDSGAHALRRLTTDGVLSMVDAGMSVQYLADLTVGPDSALWFTASAAGATVVGRAQVLGAPGAPQHLAAVAGTGTATLAWQAGPDGGAAVTGYTVTATPGGASCSWVSGPLSCVITGLDQATTYTFTARATSGKGQGPASAPSNPIVPRAGTRFHPVPPTRVLDSRTAVGGWSGPLIDPKDLGLASAVPATATAVVMNVTVTEPLQPAYLTVWPTGQPRPLASNLNFGTGQTIANLVTVQLGAGQAVSFAASSGPTHVIADLVGWFDDGTVAGDRFNATGPTRALDSRTVTGEWNGSLVAGTPQDLAFPMVPADATAVVVNVTATGSTANSYLTVWPSGAPQPNASNVNFATGQTIPNLAVVPLGANHKASFATRNGSTDVVVDVTGWFGPNGGDLFHPMPPMRVLDDRFGIGLTGPWGINTSRTLTITPPVPDGATALVANVTATNPTANSFVTVFPSGQSVPTASNLNFAADQTIPNLVMTSIGPGHGIGLHNRSGSVDLVADAVGYYAAS